MTEQVSRRMILLTGAAGRIGSAFFAATADRFAFRLAAKVGAPPAPPSPQAAWLNLDVADLAACQAACVGVDTVVHLAADPAANADFYGSLLEANIKGTYNIFRAAKDQGCRRVVFASSAQAVEGYALDQQVLTSMPVRPKNMYGVSKCFGEAVAAYFAYQEQLSSIVVRIARYAELAPDAQYNARDLSAYLSQRDLMHLLVRCVEQPDVPFAIVHGVSNNRFKRLDLSDTITRLGYAPQDDAFDLLGVPWLP